MGIWLLGLPAVTAQAQDCADPAALVADAQQAVLEGRLDDAQRTLKDVETSFGCSAIAQPEDLARMWLAEGAMFSFKGDNEGAVDSFAAAARIAPTVWEAGYGDTLKAAYDEAAAAAVTDTGTLDLKPPPPKGMGYLNGGPVAYPFNPTAGLHLVQVAPSDTSRFAQIVFIGPGDELTIQTGLPEDLQPEPEPAPEPEPVVVVEEPVTPLPVEPIEPAGKKSPVFLIAGTTAGVGAIATALLALEAQDNVANATTIEEADSAWAREQAFGYTSYGLMGVAATGVVLHFAL